MLRLPETVGREGNGSLRESPTLSKLCSHTSVPRRGSVFFTKGTHTRAPPSCALLTLSLLTPFKSFRYLGVSCPKLVSALSCQRYVALRSQSCLHVLSPRITGWCPHIYSFIWCWGGNSALWMLGKHSADWPRPLLRRPGWP